MPVKRRESGVEGMGMGEDPDERPDGTLSADEAYRMLARFLAGLAARVEDADVADDLSAASLWLLFDLPPND